MPVTSGALNTTHFWHMRLQLWIKLSDVSLNLRVDDYLGWTLALFHLILLLGSYYTLCLSYINVIVFKPVN